LSVILLEATTKNFVTCWN